MPKFKVGDRVKIQSWWLKKLRKSEHIREEFREQDYIGVIVEWSKEHGKFKYEIKEDDGHKGSWDEDKIELALEENEI